METEGLDFGGRWSRWPSATASSSSARPRTRATPRGASARERLLALLERTAAYYVRVLWESPEAADAREYLARARADGGRAARSSASATRRTRGTAC